MTSIDRVRLHIYRAVATSHRNTRGRQRGAEKNHQLIPHTTFSDSTKSCGSRDIPCCSLEHDLETRDLLVSCVHICPLASMVYINM